MMYRKKRSERIGRTRWKLWEMLQEAGFSIPGPECLWMQEGGYRNHHWDLARWGADWKALVPNGTNPINHSVYCWDTMTDCVKYGFTFSQDGPLTWEIYRKAEAGK